VKLGVFGRTYHIQRRSGIYTFSGKTLHSTKRFHWKCGWKVCAFVWFCQFAKLWISWSIRNVFVKILQTLCLCYLCLNKLRNLFKKWSAKFPCMCTLKHLCVLEPRDVCRRIHEFSPLWTLSEDLRISHGFALPQFRAQAPFRHKRYKYKLDSQINISYTYKYGNISRIK
jgi:hypothetical protein